MLGLVWCTVPAFGGWSWASDSPEFLFNAGEDDETRVTVAISGGFEGGPERVDFKKAAVVLEVPDGTDVKVANYDGFKVKVKQTHDQEDEARLRVVVNDARYSLSQVTVTLDPDPGGEIEPQTSEPGEWMFRFDLP
jgi:hypothetical protein